MSVKNIFSLEGRKSVVIGGAGGIGQAIAQGLAEFGAEVMISSRKEESLQRAAAEIKEACGLEVSYCTGDATSEEDVQKLADYAVEKMGKVDILVCSQGFNQKYPFLDFDMNAFENMLKVNVTGVMLCNKIFGKIMKENGYGKIIDISSVRSEIATFPMPGNAGYCATKGALNMIIRQGAAELAPEVTVNGIGPTVTATPMLAKMLTPEIEENLAKQHPMNRMAVPEDCVGAAIYLASEASGFTTGQIIYPDGGLLCKG